MKIFYFLIIALSLMLIPCCKKDSNSPISSSTKGTIKGEITDLSSGAIITGVTITTTPITYTVVSDTAGGYTITEVEAGSYYVIAAKIGYYTIAEPTTVIANKTSIVNITIGHQTP